MNSKPATGEEGELNPRKRVLIIDDHVIVRQGLIHLINQEKDLIVCGEAEDGRSGLSAIFSLKPDVVLADVSLPGMNGIEFIKNIKACHSGLPIVVLSMHDESLYAERVLRAGALGYVTKKAASETIIAALRKALKGELYTHGTFAAALLQTLLSKQQPNDGSPVSVLSDRELEVFVMIGNGKSTHEIADALNLSVKTVDSHRTHIKDKLDLHTATELVKRAVLHIENEMAD